MLFNDVIKLVTTAKTVDENGYPIETIEEGPFIYAQKQSVQRTEFYQASAAGFKPEIVFVIHSFEYNKEPKLIYDETEYKIIRTYQKDTEYIELICQCMEVSS